MRRSRVGLLELRTRTVSLLARIARVTAAIRCLSVLQFVGVTVIAYLIVGYGWILMLEGAFGGDLRSGNTGILLFTITFVVWAIFAFVWLARGRNG